jgi:hypothetical protein
MSVTMYRITKRPALLVAILVPTVVIAALGMIAAFESQSGQSPPRNEVSSAERKQQVFELRVSNSRVHGDRIEIQ